MNYYNEYEPFAAEWLKELIKDGLIPDGEVDTRSIVDVAPEDLKDFKQCHFFAGIGGWAYAARLAGWGDDRPMWTGSPPCQPFSTAGKQDGASDERHLWPVWFNLLRECRPPIVFGEQVSAAITFGWLDALQQDLENEGYACGAIVLPASGVGAPHKRDRLWIVANANDIRHERNQEAGRKAQRRTEHASAINMAHPYVSRQPGSGQMGRSCDTKKSEAQEVHRAFNVGRISSSESQYNEKSVAYSNSSQRQREWISGGIEQENSPARSHAPYDFWANSEIVYCRDGKHRAIPTEPEIFPLANGIPNRVGTLRGAGNAIVPQVAAEIIGLFV